MKAKIFISLSSTAPRATNKKYGYVLEFAGKNGPITRDGTGEVEATYHAAALEALLVAMRRFTKPCEIEIHCEDGYICSMVERNLPEWIANGFVGKKGEKIKNKELWEQLGALLKEHKITMVPGNHEYSKWLREEMEGT